MKDRYCDWPAKGLEIGKGLTSFFQLFQLIIDCLIPLDLKKANCYVPYKGKNKPSNSVMNMTAHTLAKFCEHSISSFIHNGVSKCIRKSLYNDVCDE